MIKCVDVIEKEQIVSLAKLHSTYATEYKTKFLYNELLKAKLSRMIIDNVIVHLPRFFSNPKIDYHNVSDLDKHNFKLVIDTVAKCPELKYKIQ